MRDLSRRVHDGCHAHPVVSTLVSALCRILEWSGDGRPWIALWAVLAYVSLSEGGGPTVTTTMVMAASEPARLLRLLVVDLALVGCLKWAVKRRRPSYGRAPQTYVVEVDRYSFPSGHASRAMALAVGWLPSRVPLFWGVAWAMAVGTSRVAYGRHWASDVVAGWVVGLLVVAIEATVATVATVDRI